MCSYTKIHEWQTRLALIKPHEDLSACLELSLVVVDLVDLSTGAVINHDTLVEYDALSYAWGNSPPSVKCICDGVTIFLRDNLDSALRFIRKPQDARYVWIDFLCINQDDLVEKAFQIPRMKNIFSKASTVVVWLGESLPVANIIRRCSKECGLDVVYLTCPDHGNELWKSILDYAWFRRTWVRQEVFAAEKLDVCCPYFSATWEFFNEALGSVDYKGSPGSAFSHEAVQNLDSLNKLYSSRRLKLLDLLKQGKGFQASVPHDHIFSVLGMMGTPKHSKRGTIPVTYNKTYHEVCGDVTRYVIRESRSIRILQWCTWQNDRSYAFDWPTIEWSDPTNNEFVLPHSDGKGVFSKEFDLENPVRGVNDSKPSKNTDSSVISSQSVSNRPLVLYGRVWGTLTGQIDSVTLLDDSDIDRLQERSVSAFVIDHEADKKPGTESSLGRHADIYREFLIHKNSVMIRIFPNAKKDYSRVNAWWRCYGCVSKGDMFVSLEPGPHNVLLRKCSISGDMFEVVGWDFGAIRVGDLSPVYERYYDWYDGVLKQAYPDKIGPRKRFEIR